MTPNEMLWFYIGVACGTVFGIVGGCIGAYFGIKMVFRKGTEP